eukprot:8369439-Karenia_brevis.AAC.1
MPVLSGGAETRTGAHPGAAAFATTSSEKDARYTTSAAAKRQSWAIAVSISFLLTFTSPSPRGA